MTRPSDQSDDELSLPNTVTIEQGRKSLGDRIVKNHGHAFTWYELIHMLNQLFKAEDSNYPPPFLRGGDYIVDMIQDLRKLGKVTAEFCQKYRIPIKESR
tara:strand:+ start:1970 stop:2269 length:300 start_codon:yes stop_codon:yes gene_type:complete